MARIATSVNPFQGAADSDFTSDAMVVGGVADLTLGLVVTSASTFTTQLSNAAVPAETDWASLGTVTVTSGATAIVLPTGFLHFRILRSNHSNTVSLGKNYR